MIMDVQALLSDRQNLAGAAAGNHLSSNSIDTGAPGSTVLGGTVRKDFGRGNKPMLLVQVVETITSAGAATVQAQVVKGTAVDGNGQISAGLEVVAQSAPVPVADLAAGYQFPLELPPKLDTRYFAIRYVVGTAALTAGRVTAGLVLDRQQQG